MTNKPSNPENIHSAPFFAFRTPLLPWQVYEDLKSGTVDLELSAAREAVRGRLRMLVEWPGIREALFVASPDLDAALPLWVKDPESEKGQRAERSIMRYVARMSGRSTPFGLFAGCSVGSIGGVGTTTRIIMDGQERYLRHSRLDMDYLTALTTKLSRDKSLRLKLLFRPNSSLYRAGGRLRYAEARIRGKDRAYHLVAVEETPILLSLLRSAEGGAVLQDLAANLVDGEISFEEAIEFLHELVDHQILMPELQPAVTGPEPTHDLIRQLHAIPEGDSFATVLEGAQQALERLDAEPFGVPTSRYLEIAESLRQLPNEVELNRLFQVDMVKPSPKAILGGEVMNDIRKGLSLLHRLFGASRSEALKKFSEAFQERYEQEEQPLEKVLDEEYGIGFGNSNAPGAEGSPLLEGMVFAGTTSDSSTIWTDLHGFLLRKLLEHPSARVLQMEEKDFDPYLLSSPMPLPGSFSVMAKLASRSHDALDRGEFQVYISGVSGPSGANLLGRFCHGDVGLTDHVRSHLAEEEALNPEAVFAEIAHLPEGRIGNVILRPNLRGHEIPFLGRSGLEEVAQIPISDLTVSIQNGRVVLRSKRLGKEILPRLTNAHNYSFHSMGVYRFLCMLQHQGHIGGLSWSWGALESAAFLPRVEVGRLVLAKARWRVDGKDAKALAEAKEGERWERIQAWQARVGAPKLLLLADGDKKLPVDLDNPLSIEAFIDVVKKRNNFTLEEFYPGPEDLVAMGPEGRFVHELVVPFIATSKPTPVPREPGGDTDARRFLPGSEWLYAKIYTGTSGVDQILRENLRPLIDDLRVRGVVDKWFFIRYSDPDWHLRLRLNGDPTRLAAEAMPELYALGERLRGQSRIWKFQLDTYVRELERYGGAEALALCETLFQADSEAVLDILAAYQGDSAADARWRLCLMGMHLLLLDLGFSLSGRAELLSGIREAYLRDFNGGDAFERQLSDRFRKERNALERLVAKSDENHILNPGLEALARRSAALALVGGGLNRLSREGRLGRSLQDLAGSFLHMHANRLLRSAARAQELILYDFLSRIYTSQVARERKGVRTLSPE